MEVEMISDEERREVARKLRKAITEETEERR